MPLFTPAQRSWLSSASGCSPNACGITAGARLRTVTVFSCCVPLLRSRLAHILSSSSCTLHFMPAAHLFAIRLRAEAGLNCTIDCVNAQTSLAAGFPRRCHLSGTPTWPAAQTGAHARRGRGRRAQVDNGAGVVRDTAVDLTWSIIYQLSFQSSWQQLAPSTRQKPPETSPAGAEQSTWAAWRRPHASARPSRQIW